MNRFGEDFKESFRQKTTDLVRDKILLYIPKEHKISLLDKLIEDYVQETGQVPPSYSLTLLTTWLLHESENNPDKVTKEEYPVFSESQLKHRLKRELPTEYLDKTSDSSKHKISGRRINHQEYEE